MSLHFSVMLSENRLELLVKEHPALYMDHVKGNKKGKERGNAVCREEKASGRTVGFVTSPVKKMALSLA